MICFRVIPFRCDFPGAFFIMGIYYRKVALVSSRNGLCLGDYKVKLTASVALTMGEVLKGVVLLQKAREFVRTFLFLDISLGIRAGV